MYIDVFTSADISVDIWVDINVDNSAVFSIDISVDTTDEIRVDIWVHNSVDSIVDNSFGKSWSLKKDVFINLKDVQYPSKIANI